MVSLVPADRPELEQRYQTLKALGQGSAGAVYLVRDRDTGEHVALKKLLRLDPKSVLRLKREFRSMADMHHPNLVKLYDLAHAVDGWFLTMEFVDGPDLLGYLGEDPERAAASDVSTTREQGIGAARAALGHVRVLGAFHQLACGVRALHAAGMLHRDLKPSNVLVAHDRVVVLDFGLVHELDADGAHATAEGFVSGTPAYMAPEQAQGLALSEASDWYAFGIMLYQALSGVLPIEGRSALELLMRKCEIDPTPLDRLVPHVPRALSALCMALLQREPRARPSGAEIILTLERERAAFAVRHDAQPSLDFTVRTTTATHKRSDSLVGREPELMQLRAALDTAAQGSAVMLHVRGASGAGKSALVEHFVARLDGEPLPLLREPLILRSRCYEREAMPFKALDGVMDALINHLAQLDDFERGHLLPAELPELVQLFPALQRLQGVEQLLSAAAPRGDRAQTRHRAEHGLGELFARLAAHRPIVLWIDDLQWGDLDSATILRSWRRELAQAPILFVFSYRGDEATTSECLSTLLERESDPSLPAPRALERVIELASLEALDLRLLCERRLGELAEQRPDLVERIAHESRGNPFLVAQLAALVQARLALGDQKLESLTIEQLVVQTRALLPPGAVELLNTLAIAGKPLRPKLALQAARIHSEGRALLHALRGLRLIRTRDIGGTPHLEVYHDRVREGAQAALDARERARLHESLLRVLEAEGATDADWLHSLALGAGLRLQALQYGRAAAERAAAVLAFERAAELYATCLQLTDSGADERRALYQLRADALARAGRGVAAADAYLEAAKLTTDEASGPTRVALLRSASSHLIRCGEYARGEVIAREVLSASAATLPASEAGLLAAIAWERTALALRGLSFEPRTEPIPPDLKQKIELFAALSIEHQALDPLRATLMQARSLRWALAAGDRRLVARALCLSATMICVTGSKRAERQSGEMLERAAALAEELKDEALLGNTLAARAVCGFLLGRPGDVIEASYEAERISRAHPESDGYYHRYTVVAARIGALQIRGDHRRAQAELHGTLQEARATDNRSAALHLALAQTFMDEVQNRPEHAKPRLIEQRRALPPSGFGPLHMMHMLALMRASCATADFAWADEWIEADWARWKRSPVRASAFLTLLARGAHARYVLNRHVIERGRGDPAKLAREDLRALERLPYESWRIGGQCRTLARLAFLAGDRETAARHLRETITQIQRVGAADEESRDRYALGFVIGGQEGAGLRAAAELEMRQHGVVDPLAELQSHYPELIRAASSSNGSGAAPIGDSLRRTARP